jgi:hypothetical protein
VKLPAKPFGEWTFAEVSALAEDDDSADGRAIRLKRDMAETGANTVAELGREAALRHEPRFREETSE